MIYDLTDFQMPGKLEDYSAGRTTWGYLAPQIEHGHLYYVDAALDMREAAAAIARDDSDQVAAWLRSGDLVKLEEIHASQWSAAETMFDAMVVSPFVLCRLAADA